MSKLSDLLEPVKRKHVLEAIREFDRLGRKRFLEKYKFGKARTCLLIHEGKKYDSKAIMGVAYGFADKKAGPLTPSHDDFYGGESLLQELRKRDFECRHDSQPE